MTELNELKHKTLNCQIMRVEVISALIVLCKTIYPQNDIEGINAETVA